MAYLDPERQRQYARAHYQRNKELYKAHAVTHTRGAKEQARAFIKQYLTEHPCVDCGFRDTRALEFDHLRDKRQTISHMVSQGWSLDSIEKEIEKCEVRCANCHRIVTHERRSGGVA